MRGFVVALTMALTLSAGSDRTAAEIADLARAARSDPASLADLRSTRSVDDEHVDLASALDRGDLAEAVVVLVRLPISEVDQGEVDRAVSRVLDAPKYERRVEGPFDRFLRRLTAWAVSMLGRAVGWLGGNLVATLLAALVLASAVVATAFGLGRRRVRESERRAVMERLLAMGPDPADLERLASEASLAGDHGLAVRLRFVAGLARLDEQGRIRLRPGLPTHRIQETLAEPEFDALVRTFEEVAYGGRPASFADDEASIRGWIRLTGRVPV